MTMWADLVFAGMSSLTLTDLEGMAYFEIHTLHERVKFLNKKQEEAYTEASSQQENEK